MNDDIRKIADYCDEHNYAIISIDEIEGTFLVQLENGTPRLCHFSQVFGEDE